MNKRPFNNVSAVNPHECCGCSACANSCPKNCIEMRNSKADWALYPTIGINCIQCGHCKSVCPALNKKPIAHAPLGVYAFKNSLEVRKTSSSGGVFFSLAKYILNINGVVCGAAFADNTGYKIKHIFIDNIDELHKLQGSKYIQSRTTGIYSKIKDFLNKNPQRFLLFSGTPCQVAGLKLFLKRSYNNLITVDLVCHGVGSEELFAKYIMENYTNFKGVAFRDKRVSQLCTNLYLYDIYNNFHVRDHKDPFEIAFHRSLMVRDSCMNCKYATLPRVADITIGDFWGLKKIENGKYAGFDDGLGVSLVLLNSSVGLNIFNLIKSDHHIDLLKINSKEFVKFNSFNQKRISKGNRELFFNSVRFKSFSESVNLAIRQSTGKKTTKHSQRHSFLNKLLVYLKFKHV